MAINLDARAGRAWRLYQRRGTTTLHPSVWRDSGCECHFIVWKDEIYVFGAIEEAEEERAQDRLWAREVGIARASVLGALDRDALRSYVDVADQLDAVPWEVLIVCRRLVKEGVAIEGIDDNRGHFARAPARSRAIYYRAASRRPVTYRLDRSDRWPLVRVSSVRRSMRFLES